MKIEEKNSDKGRDILLQRNTANMEKENEMQK